MSTLPSIDKQFKQLKKKLHKKDKIFVIECADCSWPYMLHQDMCPKCYGVNDYCSFSGKKKPNKKKTEKAHKKIEVIAKQMFGEKPAEKLIELKSQNSFVTQNSIRRSL